MIRCFVLPLLAVSYAADRDHCSADYLGNAGGDRGIGLITATETEIPAAADRARRA